MSPWAPLSHSSLSTSSEVMKSLPTLWLPTQWETISMTHKFYSPEKLENETEVIIRDDRREGWGSGLCLKRQTELLDTGVDKSQVLWPICSSPAGKWSYACASLSSTRQEGLLWKNTMTLVKTSFYCLITQPNIHSLDYTTELVINF